MKLLSALLLALASSSTAAAQDQPPPVFESGAMPARLRGRPTPVPANGALPIESPDSSIPIVTVTDPNGALIEGSVHEAGYLDPGLLQAWVPSHELSEGIYQVTLQHPWEESLHSTVSVEIVAPISAELPELRFDPSASWRSTPGDFLPRACCETPLGQEVFDSCFTTEKDSFVAVDPGMSSSAPGSQLNQYVFRLWIPAGAEGGGADLPFEPLEKVRPANYSVAADRYCVEVQAQNIVTLEVQTYPVAACTAEGIDEQVGRTAADIDEHLDVRLCDVPPAEYEARWCEVNAPICASDPGWCELYDFNCNDGPLPAVWQQIQEDMDNGLLGEPGQQSAGMSGSDVDRPSGGCSAGGRPKDGLAVALVPVLAGLTMRRRRSRPPKPTPGT